MGIGNKLKTLSNKRKSESSTIEMLRSRSLKRICGVMIVGAGDISRCYFDHCQHDKRTDIVAVADPNKKAREWAKDKYNIKLIEQDYEKLLDRDDIDVVIIATPHYLHHSMVISSLRAGKDVICEKPISISVQEADEMIDLAQKLDKKLLITLNSRFIPRTFEIKKLLSQKRLGDIFMSHSAYLGYEYKRMADSEHWKGDLVKAGGGVLLDGGYHIVDLMNSFLGRAKYVEALGGQYLLSSPDKGEDNISLLVEYECGAIADIQVSFTVCTVGSDREPTLMIDLDLYGSKGSMRYSYEWDAMEIHEKMNLLVKGENRKSIDLKNGNYPNCYQHFFDCLIDNSKPIATALDARNALAVIKAAYESMHCGKKIEVDWRS